MSIEHRGEGRRARTQDPQSSVLNPQSCSFVRVTQHVTLERVLDQLRDGLSESVTLLLDPLSVLFATPDHFRALDAVRIARRLSLTIEVADAHRTGLALAFGYRVRQPGNHREERTAPVPDIQHGPPNRTGAIIAPPPAGSRQGVGAVLEPPAIARRSARRPRRLLLRLLLIVCVALCGVGGGVVVWAAHTATVIVQPAEQSFSRVVPFAVSVMPTNDPNTLQTHAFETTITREGDAPATGSAAVPDGTASGVMTFRSRADGATTVKAGAALKGPHDISYLLQSDVAVPGLDFARGKLGEATVKVQAAQPGSVGNLGAGFSARYTDNLTYFSGDITGGTDKQVPVVSDGDIAGARVRLEAELRMHALTEVNAALPTGTTAMNDYLTLRPPTVTTQPSSGAQADTVHVRVAITAQIPVYQNADFDALIDRRLTETVRDPSLTDGGARTIVPASVVKSKPVFVDVQGPLVRYFATVTGTTRAVVSDAMLSRLRAALAGQDARGAVQVLASEPALGAHTIRYGPSWLPTPLRDRMPRTASHIHLSLSRQS